MLQKKLELLQDSWMKTLIFLKEKVSLIPEGNFETGTERILVFKNMHCTQIRLFNWQELFLLIHISCTDDTIDYFSWDPKSKKIIWIKQNNDTPIQINHGTLTKLDVDQNIPLENMLHTDSIVINNTINTDCSRAITYEYDMINMIWHFTTIQNHTQKIKNEIAALLEQQN